MITLAMWLTSALLCAPLADLSTPRPSLRALEAMWERSKQYASQGDCRRALAGYLFVFDNGRHVEELLGLRNSFLLIDIAKLASSCPDAIRSLAQRRDDRERRLLDGDTEWDTIFEMVALNNQLGAAERSVAVYDKLKEMGSNREWGRKALADYLKHELTRLGRYGELGEAAEGIARLLPTHCLLLSRLYNASFHEEIVRNAHLAYDTFLFLGQVERLPQLERLLTRVKDADALYPALIRSALKFGRPTIAARLRYEYQVRQRPFLRGGKTSR